MNKKLKTYLIHLGLFVLTLITTTLAGAEWSLGKFVILGMSWDDFLFGFHFSIPFLAILTIHEFGHYFTARFHHIKVSLPYYIPLWLGFLASPSIGTMGAFIKIREVISSRTQYFDVGISGPIAGFVVAVFILGYGFTHLPEEDYLYKVHPEYLEYGTLDEAIEAEEGMVIVLGGNLLFDFFRNHVADPSLLPHPHEIIHYPWILAGYLGLFFTALNLLPIGQLDGGHVLFGMFGSKYHALISRIFFTGYLFYAGLGWISVSDLADRSLEALALFLLEVGIYLYLLYLCAFSMFKETQSRLLYATLVFTAQFFASTFFQIEGYVGWLAFAFILGRVIGIDHPPVLDNRPISPARKVAGWMAILIFILCFSPKPLVIGGL